MPSCFVTRCIASLLTKGVARPRLRSRRHVAQASRRHEQFTSSCGPALRDERTLSGGYFASIAAHFAAVVSRTRRTRLPSHTRRVETAALHCEPDCRATFQSSVYNSLSYGLGVQPCSVNVCAFKEHQHLRARFHCPTRPIPSGRQFNVVGPGPRGENASDAGAASKQPGSMNAQTQRPGLPTQSAVPHAAAEAAFGDGLAALLVPDSARPGRRLVSPEQRTSTLRSRFHRRRFTP